MPPITEAAVLGADARGRPIVSLHAKRTYDIKSDGLCARAERQLGFLNFADGVPVNPGSEPIADTDLMPYKSTTDLIVVAKAYGKPRTSTTRTLARIELGSLVRDHLVLGDRRCVMRGPGRVEFSNPEPFEAIPLTFEHAYGGHDPTVEDPTPHTMLEAMQPVPGYYPRNPVGRGFVVNADPAHVEGLLLPNIEKPDDRLTPERFFTGRLDQWWRQPLPWSCDPFDRAWYPRCIWNGIAPDHLPDDDAEIPEVKLGFLPPGQGRRLRAAKIDDLFDPRLGDAAAPGLALPPLRGDEAIRFTGMTASGSFVVKLPGAPPRFSIRYKGRTEDLKPVPHRIVVSLEKSGLSIVWQAGWLAPEAFIEHVPAPGERLTAGIDHLVDGQPIELVL